MCEALRRQHGFDAISLMPTNLYGPGDNYDVNNSHVLPAMIRRFQDAASNNVPKVTCWGSGEPLRDFLHVDDLAEACVIALEQWQPGPEEQQYLNVGTGIDLSIRELAEEIAKSTGYQGEIYWDTTKPDGTQKKQLDISRIRKIGWEARIPLSSGIADAIADFKTSTRA